MKVALPQWQNRLSPVFDEAATMLLVDVEENQETQRQSLALDTKDYWGRAVVLSGQGVDLVICGAISQLHEAALRSNQIEILANRCGLIESIVTAYLTGEINAPGFFMPGCQQPDSNDPNCGKENNKPTNRNG